MTDTDPIWALLSSSDDPADVLAGAIFAGAWFPPNPRDTDEDDDPAESPGSSS